ncbi:MAG: iron-sulfur cluster assembly accessory protein, partial [Acidobacteria bacterium]|nr:iron-sulfur cluster assembly accessory protein [Acidobacteriota bacterium]
MATVTTPNIETTPKAPPVTLTPTAIAKVKEIMAQQD